MGEEVIITHTFFSDPEPSSSEWYRLSPSGEWQSLDPLEHTTLSNQAIITTVKYGISIHSSGYMNSLTIKYMKPSDLSYYVLNVRNEYGNMTAKIHVKQNSEFEGIIDYYTSKINGQLGIFRKTDTLHLLYAICFT